MKKVLGFIMALSLFGCASASTTAAVSEEAETGKLTITNNVDILSIKADMSEYQWLENDTGTVFLETTMSEVQKLFTENGSGIIYFGYVGCPWCERAVPVLNEAALEAGVTVYYINVHSTANTLDDYYELEPYIVEVFELDANREPVFKVPEVIGVKDGEIVGHHLALLEDFVIENAESQMSEEQNEELKQIYLDIMRDVAD